MEAVLDGSGQTLGATAGPGPRVTEACATQEARLQRFVRSRIGDSADVEDIVQEVFYELTAADRLMQPIGQLAAWLLQVARNRIIDRFRSRKVESLSQPKYGEDDDEAVSLEDLLPSPESGPEAAYARSVLLEEIDEALEEMPAEQRSVFIAHEWQGYSFKELSAETGVSVNTLLSRKRYAVLHLRRRLQSIREEFAKK